MYDLPPPADYPMSSHDDQQRAPEDATAEELVINSNSTMYEQNNSSEEELEVIINGQAGTFSRTTPDEFSDTGDDEEGVVYEIQAVVPEPVTVRLCAVNVTEDQLAANSSDNEGAEGDDEDDPRNIPGGQTQVAFRRPSTAEKRKRPIDEGHEEEVCTRCVWLSLSSHCS